MAQSNGPGRQGAGGFPPRQPGTNSQGKPVDPRFANQPAQSADGWQQNPQQGQYPNGGDPRFGGQDGAPQAQGYNFPQGAGQPDPRFDYGAGGGAPAAQSEHDAFAPQFGSHGGAGGDAYQQQPQHGHGGGQQQPPFYEDTPVTGAGYPAQGYSDPSAPQGMSNPAFPSQSPGDAPTQGGPAHQGYQPAGPDNGYQGGGEEWPTTGGAPGHATQVPDAHGFDAGGYAGAHPGVEQPGYLAHPDYGQAPQQADPYGGNPGGGYPADQLGHGDPRLGEHGDDLEAGYGDDEYGDQFEPSGGGTNRMMLIAGVLVGAIAVGGGLAYGWKTISGSGGGKTGDTPVVRGAGTPSKTRPENPGGQQFDHKNSKVMGRLGDARSGGATAAGGPREVPTLSVSRDGRIVPPGGAATSEPTVSVPGLTVVDAFGAGQPGTGPGGRSVTTTRQPIVVNPPSGTAKPPAQQARVAPKKPVVITAPSTKPGTATAKPAAPTTAPKTAAPAPTKKPAVPAPTKQATAKPAPSVPAAPTVSTASKGYVAVLASVPVSAGSRMNALERYADLQQKYSAVLANKTPDVREANLGERGKYHRLLVGPPSSRAQASALCGKLKSAGYSGCWVTAY